MAEVVPLFAALTVVGNIRSAAEETATVSVRTAHILTT
jgi:hypothetical protein